MDLLLVALPDSGLPEVGASIARRNAVRVESIEGDLTQDSTIEALIDRILTARLDIRLLVNNAGIGGVGLFTDLPLEHHISTIQLNITALVRLSRLVMGESAEGGRLSILNVVSLGALFPMPTLSVYSATKSFVLNFSLALRAELEGFASVSVLCPNAIRTNTAVEEYIDTFGLLGRLVCMSAEKTARIALDGALRGRAVIIPGRFNRVLAAAARFVPRSLAMRVIRNCWGGFADRDESVRVKVEHA
jgi:short-subunit dehydrogenase